VGGLEAMAGSCSGAVPQSADAPYVMEVRAEPQSRHSLAMIAGAAATVGSQRPPSGRWAPCNRVLDRFAAAELHSLLLTGVKLQPARAVALVRCCLQLEDSGRSPPLGRVFLGFAGRSGWALSPWGSVLAAVFAAGLALLVARL